MKRAVLGELCDFFNGGAWSDKEYVSSGLPVLKVINFKTKGFQIEDINYLPFSSKENYAKMQSTFSCWALLDETGWHEKGKMGWWAMNDSTKDSEQLFLEKFTETINKPENQDKYLIIVDCHI